MENKPNGNKNSFRVKDRAKLAADDFIVNTPAPTKIFNTPAEAQATDILEESVTEDSNNNHVPCIEEHDLRDLKTAGEQINDLKKEIVALREFILEQLHVVKKSEEDLKKQQQAPENSPLFESIKEKIVYLRTENKNKTETIKVLSENQRYKNNEIPRMINDSFDPENKTQSKGNVSKKPDMSPGNDHDTTMTQNSEPV